MKDKLFVIGFLAVSRGLPVRWEIYPFFGTEKALVAELGKSKFWAMEYDLNKSRENAFICEYDEEKGKVLRDDLFTKAFPRLCDPSADPCLIDLDISVRALNGLREMNIWYLSKIVELCVVDGKKFVPIKRKNFGKKTNDELKQLLMIHRALASDWPGREVFI